MFVLFVVVLQQAPSPQAWSSARPGECGTVESGRAANVWERAKSPELRKYCDLLSSGASKLAGTTGAANDVVAIAEQADRTLPNRAAPRVLKGRALAQMQKYPEALVALRDAKAKDERALDDPQALLAWARALARTGNTKEAADAYRALLPRASMLTLADRASACLEAGMLAMGRGAQGLDEAIPIFRQALRDSQDVTQTIVAMALALALDRAGDRDEAKALLAERLHGDPRPALASPRVKEILGPLGASELPALTGLALEGIDPAASRAEWQKYLEGAGKGPWAEHARGHEPQSGAKKPARGAR